MLGGCQWPEFGLWRSSWALWFSAGILGQGKDELSKMHTEKLGRGEDNLAWLCCCFREWQSPAGWGADLPCAQSIDSQGSCGPPCTDWGLSPALCPLPALPNDAINKRSCVPDFSGKAEKGAVMSLGCWCPDVSGTDGLLRKQETWRKSQPFPSLSLIFHVYQSTEDEFHCVWLCWEGREGNILSKQSVFIKKGDELCSVL